LERLVKLLGLPTSLPGDLDPDEVLAFTRTDKKGREGRPRYVLLAQAGQVASAPDWAQEVPDEVVRSVLRERGP
jgi:3-dehydroquinate synthase